MSVDAQETGRYIRQYRKVAGLTQEELAQKVGISTMSIRRYESGERIASRDMLHAIATALEVDIYSLADFDTASKMLEDRMNAKDRVNAAMEQMSQDGQNRVADYAEDILPRYKAGKAPQSAPESPPPTQEDTDTTPPPDAPETPPKGK